MTKKGIGIGIAIAIIGIVAIVSSQNDISDVPENGTLQGMVSYIGKPCPPTQLTVPPCSGPYPNYDIIIFDSDEITEISSTISDENGNYKISLMPDDYVVYQKQRQQNKMVDYALPVTIISKQVTSQDIIIDGGIR